MKQQLPNNILHPIITVDMLRINAAEDVEVIGFLSELNDPANLPKRKSLKRIAESLILAGVEATSSDLGKPDRCTRRGPPALRASFENGMIPIWRGCQRGRERGLSWTTQREVAEGFAEGKRCFNANPTLVSSVIPKKHIFGVFLSREESEIAVDPRRLRQIESRATAHYDFLKRDE